jgi:hypothetical protein
MRDTSQIGGWIRRTFPLLLNSSTRGGYVTNRGMFPFLLNFSTREGYVTNRGIFPFLLNFITHEGYVTNRGMDMSSGTKSSWKREWER